MHAALFLVAQMLTGAQAAPVDPAQPALVSGRVLDADTGRPIPGALVTPYGAAAASGTGAVVMTNRSGQFVIRGLQAGNLVLIARKGGYVDATQGQTRPAGFAQPLRISAGKRYLDTDIRMWRHGVISGTVLDEAGDPVIGVRVRAYVTVRAGGRTGYTESGSATTDDRGAYRIAQLVPGAYVVAVVSKQTSIPTEVMQVFFGGASTRAERDALGRELKAIDAAVIPAGSSLATTVGGQTIPLEPGTATPTSQGAGLLVYPTTFYPSARTASQAAPVAVRSGIERGNVDLLLRLERTSRVSGTLVAPDGLAAHVAVRLSLAGEEAAAPLDAAVTITDAAGGFTFAGVTAGQYMLSAVRLPQAPDAPDATWAAQLPLAVGDQDVADVNVVLQAAPRMSGRLEFDGAADRPDPATLSNLRIILEPADGSPAAPGLENGSGHPDPDGGFRTVGVPPGRYVVRVGGPLAGWTLKSAQFEGRDLADSAVDMTKDVTGVVLTFTDRPASIEGRVQSGMQPDAEAVVAAYPVDEAAWSGAGAAARRIKVAHAARDGSFTLANVPPGDYYVVAVKDDPSSWQDPSLLRALAPAARQVRVLDGERTAVMLRTVVMK